MDPLVARESKEQEEVVLSALRRAFEKKYSAETIAALEHCRRGLQAYFDEDYAKAIRELSDPSIYKNSALGDYAYFYLGASHQQNGSLLESKAAYEKLSMAYRNSGLLLAAKMQLAKCERALGNYRAAILALQPLMALNNPAALLMAAECYDLLGDSQSAGKIYDRIYYEFPTTVEAAVAANRLDSYAVNEKPTYAKMIKRVDGFIKGGQYKQALKELDEIVDEKPAQMSKDELRLKRGICYYYMGQYKLALSSLKQVRAANAKVHAEALYYMFQTERKLHLSEDMDSVARALQRSYPTDKFTGSTLYLLAASYELKKQPDMAQELHKFIVENFSTGTYCERSDWKLAWQTYLSKDYNAAALRLSDHIRRFPQSQTNLAALFWLGRAYEKLGQHQKSSYIYQAIRASSPNGFYGLLARKRLAQRSARQQEETNRFPEIDNILALIKPQAASTKLEVAQLEPHLEKFRQLSYMRFDDLAFKHLAFIIGSDPTQLNFLEYEAHSSWDHLRWIRALSKLLPNYHVYEQDQLPSRIWRLLFPLENWKKIKIEAAKYNIDPYMISALIRQESTFNPRAVSRAKAVGLMQILPSTGRQIARSKHQRKFTAKRLYDPNLNIDFGVYYFSRLLERYGGKVELALAAYNGGAGRVDAWRDQFSTGDIYELVESIPITETREYVKNIVTIANHYRKIYGAQ